MGGRTLELPIDPLVTQVGLRIWKSDLAQYLIEGMLIHDGSVFKRLAPGNNSKCGAMCIYTQKYSAPFIMEKN